MKNVLFLGVAMVLAASLPSYAADTAVMKVNLPTKDGALYSAGNPMRGPLTAATCETPNFWCHYSSSDYDTGDNCSCCRNGTCEDGTIINSLLERLEKKYGSL